MDIRKTGNKLREADAKMMTAEIDAVTNIEAEEATTNAPKTGANEQLTGSQSSEAQMERIHKNEVENMVESRMLGRAIISSGQLENTRSGADDLSNGEIIDGLERQLMRDENEIENAEEFVGEGTALQIDERKNDDYDDLMTEEGRGLKLENKVLAKTQEKIAAEVMPVVEKIVGQPVYRPADLDEAYRHWSRDALLTLNRVLGDRN